MERPDEELWERADAILDRLLDLPAARREPALRGMRLPPELDTCVRRLLRAHGATGTLDRPPCEPERPAAMLAGRRIAGWLLERELGRGGMSVVWQASRGDGAGLQRAALKLLSVGALARHELVRFRREQAILARLNHPHIAHLYEAGESDDGTPYLAMERVEGERIDAWCEHNRLDVAARVRLVLEVCAAIAYAHRNLVVHADLKPSNVLVDTEGHVRVVDFGIGRLLDEHRGERTGTLWRAATPGYAAPEQIAGEPATTATDVFGLGALLYRLLAGRPPNERLAGDAVTAPSRVLQRGSEASDARRRADMRRIRGDLDTVLLKALASAPEQRYLSVDALAADLRAWLTLRPIRARRPHALYRFGKFARRHRIGLAASVALSVVLVGGVVATVWQARRANAEAAAARQQAQRAVAVKDFLVTLLQQTNPGRVEGDPPASALLRKGSERLRADHALAPSIRAELLRVVGVSQRARGRYRDARETLDAALKLYADGDVHDPAGEADTLSRRAWVAYELNDTDTAIRLFRQADARLTALEDGGPLTPMHMHLRANLADLLVIAGHPREGAAIARDLLRAMRQAADIPVHDRSYTLRILGSAADVEHRPQDAMRWLQQAVQALDPVQDAPSLATLHNELGLASWHAGRLDRAEREFTAAVQGYVRFFGGYDNPHTLIVRRHLAAVQLEQGRIGEATEALRGLLERLQDVFGDAPSRDVARTRFWLAVAAYRDGRTADALRQAQAALRMGARLPPGFLRQRDVMAPLLGLLRFEQQAGADEDLLQQGVPDCASGYPPAAVRRWICIARSLRRADTGACAALPPEPPAASDAAARHWQAAYQLLRARCGPALGRADAVREARRIARTAAPLPAWLQARLAEAPATAAKATARR